MGYDVYASGSWDISDDKVEAFTRAMMKACEEHDGEDPETDLGPLDYLLFRFEGDPVLLEKDPNGAVAGGLQIGFTDQDSFRHDDDERWIFEAAAPFADEGDKIYFEGEDGYRWSWTVKAGALEVQDSETIYGQDVHAPAALQKIIDLIYPGGKPVSSLPDYDSGQIMDKGHAACLSLLEAIENTIREAGFGPQAGMTELDRLADV
jgi:hypothetical protein